ncbi:hypothetical protein AMECASPLE_016259 [Ameca splendens]|uniref:Uncharacterized protein n=1 Tax=Ameca splendens TaxID=208324 RepID=A0ABV0ZZX2_9TELE
MQQMAPPNQVKNNQPSGLFASATSSSLYPREMSFPTPEQSAILPFPLPVISTQNLPDLSNAPPKYHDLQMVFSNDLALSLPTYHPYDCSCPGATFPSSQLCRMLLSFQNGIYVMVTIWSALERETNGGQLLKRMWDIQNTYLCFLASPVP